MSANPPTQTLVRDPLTGFGSREAMIACLAEAIDPESGPSVFAVFGLDGLDDFEDAYGASEADHVIVALAEEFARMVRPEGLCFAPRRREFCAHFDLPLAEVSPILAPAVISLRREGAMSQIGPVFGYVLLPGEAGNAIAALRVADRRLNDARKLQRKTQPSPPRL